MCHHACCRNVVKTTAFNVHEQTKDKVIDPSFFLFSLFLFEFTTTILFSSPDYITNAKSHMQLPPLPPSFLV